MRSSVQDNFVESLYWLNKPETAHSSWMGQISLGLAQLHKAQCPVLTSAVLSPESFQQFCRSIAWSSPFLSDFPHLSLRLQAAQPFQLQAVAKEISYSFEQTPIPPLWLQTVVADLQHLSNDWRLVPSVALPKPWAKFTPHLMEILPIQYGSLPALGNLIKQAWKSLFTARLLLLMQEWAIPLDQIRLGLLLQPVHSAQVSGFLKITETHLHIQATHGLSHNILMGEVLPDTYIFDRQTQQWHRDAGHITCTYQAHPSMPETQGLKQQGLVQTLLNPTPEHPVLDQHQLDYLLGLAHDLPDLDTSCPIVEWVFPEGESTPLTVAGLRPTLPLSGLHRSPKGPDKEQPSYLAAGLGAAVGQATAPILVCQDSSLLQPQDVANRIVVLKQVVPSDLAWLQRVAGLICTTGGHTSHGAIMARELGLPAVVGIGEALETFQSGQLVLLDGNQGKVFAASLSQITESTTPRATDAQSSPNLELQTTQLWVNLSQSQRLERALQLPVHGVGLLRAEWFLLNICQGQFPSDWLRQRGTEAFVNHLSHHLQGFVQAWHPRPVFYRSLDGKYDVHTQSKGRPSQTAHSMLGLRGGAQYMFDTTLFDLELQALARLRHHGCRNLCLILPFIRSVEEFVFCRHRLQAANLWEHLQVWMMAEVPAVLFQLPEFVAAGVQGIAIGTNDLTQLLLGVDRDNTYLTERYTVDHPAVLAALSQLIKTAKALEIPCSICGQAPVQHPELIPKFIEWGATAISVDISAVLETQAAIATAEAQLKSSSTIQNG
ncbi:putative PEP-binding protein [Acaryochloris sp. IP29b_bin.137]|uniref:putative PEP-binding protein n=1 Tax=Acaryochloris sp. IP29b_bin.137 TaxID=2969217 RepID=UPI00262A40B7|nr:putative PEP-binding protein [Acaryochloris sp. IP29b_bin.137]